MSNNLQSDKEKLSEYKAIQRARISELMSSTKSQVDPLFNATFTAGHSTLDFKAHSPEN